MNPPRTLFVNSKACSQKAKPSSNGTPDVTQQGVPEPRYIINPNSAFAKGVAYPSAVTSTPVHTTARATDAPPHQQSSPSNVAVMRTIEQALDRQSKMFDAALRGVLNTFTPTLESISSALRSLVPPNAVAVKPAVSDVSIGTDVVHNDASVSATIMSSDASVGTDGSSLSVSSKKRARAGAVDGVPKTKK